VARAGATVKTVTSTANYALDDNDLYGKLQAYRELLTESGEYASAYTVGQVDEGAASKRGIPYYQKALDALANQIATQFNNLNTNNGAKLTILNPDGTDTGKEVANSGALFSNDGKGNDTTNITAANISIARNWAEGTTRIVNSYKETVKDAGVPSTASDNIDRFIALMDKKLPYTVGTTTVFQGTFQEMLTNISSTLGSDIHSTDIQLTTAQDAAIELDTSRDSVSGVDLNDEAMGLMQYQKSYSAACRLMTVLDEVLDKLINGTGTTGL
jgi:flagellar hook-associated protein 1 FlgK